MHVFELDHGKIQPRPGYEGPEGEQRYSSTLSLTSALDGGGCSTTRPGRFNPGKDLVPFVQEAGWAPHTHFVFSNFFPKIVPFMR